MNRVWVVCWEGDDGTGCDVYGSHALASEAFVRAVLAYFRDVDSLGVDTPARAMYDLAVQGEWCQAADCYDSDAEPFSWAMYDNYLALSSEWVRQAVNANVSNLGALRGVPRGGEL